MRKRFLTYATLLLALLPAYAKEHPIYYNHYNPEVGFASVSLQLDEVFLKMAGSLEHHGSPEPYIRFVMAEMQKTEVVGKSVQRPSRMSNKNLETLISNWKMLEKPLDLKGLCKNAGKEMRYAINGFWNQPIGELVDLEKGLNEKDIEQYWVALSKSNFTDDDIGPLKSFHKNAFHKLTPRGKHGIAMRVELSLKENDEKSKEILALYDSGTQFKKILQYQSISFAADLTHEYSINLRPAAFRYSVCNYFNLGESSNTEMLNTALIDPHISFDAIKQEFDARIAHLNKNLGETKARQFEYTMSSMVHTLCVLAHCELAVAVSRKQKSQLAHKITIE